jgi:choline dehydrogenase-like flavoprotein
MGNDPKTSVLDRWNRAHDVENLYVVDGSCFVTSSGVNPTSTIVAISLRAAEHMVETRLNQRVAEQRRQLRSAVTPTPGVDGAAAARRPAAEAN